MQRKKTKELINRRIVQLIFAFVFLLIKPQVSQFSHDVTFTIPRISKMCKIALHYLQLIV